MDTLTFLKFFSNMQIFISHSSKNKDYCEALVDLLISVGISADDIICTSLEGHGIPIGQNIFTWLKSKIEEGPHVIYILSPEYYKSVACLNEMGAAWIVENEHTMIFTPDFDLKSYEFQNGALDPREIGFYINNGDKVTEFIESLKRTFSIVSKLVTINQKIRYFQSRAEIITASKKKAISDEHYKEIDQPKVEVTEKSVQKITPMVDSQKKQEHVHGRIETRKVVLNAKEDAPTKFFSAFRNDKLTDEEILLVSYIIDTGRFNLGVGWQEQHEKERIDMWEEINGLNGHLSYYYDKAIRRFDVRGITIVSDLTSSGNPKEIKLIKAVADQFLDPPDDIQAKIQEAKLRNLFKEDKDQDQSPLDFF